MRFSGLDRVVRSLALVLLGASIAGSGELNYVNTVLDGVDGFDGLAASFSVAVSPDGANLYVAGFGEDAVAVLARNPETGDLTFVEVHRDGANGVDGLDGIYAVAISPDGANLYAAGSIDHAVAVFARSPATGALTFVEVHKNGVGGIDRLRGATSVAVSPDGANVYVTSFWDHSVAVFDRSPATGSLIFMGAELDGVDGVDGLMNATGVTVSPDGNHLYAVGEGDGGLAVFSRDSATGALTFVEAELDGVGGVTALDGASAVGVSPDNANVYAASSVDNAVVVFDRDPTTGLLDLVEESVDGQGFNGMSGPRGIMVGPDGSRVYVAATTSGVLVSFSRSGATGALTYVELINNTLGVTGMAGARSVALDNAGRNLYVAGSTDNAVAIFNVTLFSDGFEWGSTAEWSLTVGGP